MRNVLYGLPVLMALWVNASVAQVAAPAGDSSSARQAGLPMGQTALPQPLDSLAGLTPDYRIGPNDAIDFEIYGVPELKKTLRVNSSGFIALPLVGNLSVAGMTGQQAEQAIAAAYADKYLQNPQVSVTIKEFTVRRLTIEGAVGRPGMYAVTSDLTLLRALALAGGGAKYADLTEIMLYRKTEDGKAPKQFIYDIEAIRDGKAPDPAVLADDVVVVKRSGARTLLRDSLFRDIIDSINPFSSLGGAP